MQVQHNDENSGGSKALSQASRPTGVMMTEVNPAFVSHSLIFQFVVVGCPFLDT